MQPKPSLFCSIAFLFLAAVCASAQNTSVSLNMTGQGVYQTGSGGFISGAGTGTLSPYGAIAGPIVSVVGGNQLVFTLTLTNDTQSSIVAMSNANFSASSITGTATITNSSGVFANLNGSFDFTISITGGTPPIVNFTVTGSGTFAGCTATLSTGGQALPASATTGSVDITTPSTCPWTATNLPTWVNFPSGTGNGTIFYFVTPNTGAARTATIAINGAPFVVEQAAGGNTGLNLTGSLAHVISGGTWGFSLSALNLGTSSANARFSFLTDNAQLFNIPWTFPQTPSYLPGGSLVGSVIDRTLAPNAQVILANTGQGSTLLGSGQLLSNGNVSGFGIFTFPAFNWNAVVPLETRNASKYFLPFDNTGVLATGVAIENLSTSNATIPVILRDDTGAQIGTPSLILAGQGHTSFVLSNQYPITATKRGSIEFDTPAGGRISVLGTRANGGALTTLPVLSSSDAAGGSIPDLTYNLGFTSTFYLMNTGSAPASFTMSFYDRTGTPVNVTMLLPQTSSQLSGTSITKTLAAGQMLELTTQANDQLPNISGSAQLTTTGSVSGFEIFNWDAFGQEASVPLETRSPGNYYLIFDNTGSLNTGVAIANAGAAAASISAKIYDDQGSLLLSPAVSLPARGQKVFMLTDANGGYPITAGKRGMVQFTVPASGPISMIGIRTNGTTLTTVPILAK